MLSRAQNGLRVMAGANRVNRVDWLGLGILVLLGQLLLTDDRAMVKGCLTNAYLFWSWRHSSKSPRPWRISSSRRQHESNEPASLPGHPETHPGRNTGI